MITDLHPRHWRALEQLPRDYPLPDLNSKLLIAKRVIETDGKLIGAGFLKLTTEASVLLDPSLRVAQRGIALRTLITQLVYAAERVGIDDCHVFLRPENRKMAEFLKKFNFVEDEDVTMYLPPRSQNGEKSYTASTR